MSEATTNSKPLHFTDLEEQICVLNNLISTLNQIDFIPDEQELKIILMERIVSRSEALQSDFHAAYEANRNEKGLQS